MALKTLKKQPRDSRLYDFDFNDLLRTTDTIAGISTTEYTPNDGNLVLSTPTTDFGKLVQMRISGGIVDTKYKVSVIVTTALGDTVELDGFLKIIDY